MGENEGVLIDEEESLVLFEFEMEMIADISTKLDWMLVAIFLLAGILVVQLFFIGKGERG